VKLPDKTSLRKRKHRVLKRNQTRVGGRRKEKVGGESWRVNEGEFKGAIGLKIISLMRGGTRFAREATIGSLELKNEKLPLGLRQRREGAKDVWSTTRGGNVKGKDLNFNSKRNPCLKGVTTWEDRDNGEWR